MYKYSVQSRQRLDTCVPDLVTLFTAVLLQVDHSILEGARTLGRQITLLDIGATRTLESKHVVTSSEPLSRAADVAPYPYDPQGIGGAVEQILNPITELTEEVLVKLLKNVLRYGYFAGVVKTTARQLGINIRWGGDWDSDNVFMDQSFDDLVHYEIMEG